MSSYGIVYPKFKAAVYSGQPNTNLLTSSPPEEGVYAQPLILQNVVSTSEFYTDYSASYYVSTPQQILNPSITTTGIFKGDGVTFPLVPNAGSYIYSIQIFRKNSGASNTWRLIAWVDYRDTIGLTMTPDGTSNIYVGWSPTGIIYL